MRVFRLLGFVLVFSLLAGGVNAQDKPDGKKDAQAKKEKPKAEEKKGEAVKPEPSPFDKDMGAVVMLHRKKKYDEALKGLDGLAKKYPKQRTAIQRRRALVYVSQKNFVEADKILLEELKNDTDGSIYMELALVDARQKNKEAGLAHLVEGLKKYPKNINILLQLAVHTPEKDKQVKLYEEALVLDPENTMAMNNLAALYMAAGEPAKAAKTMEAYRKKRPAGSGMLNLGRAYLATNQPDQALAVFREMAEKKGGVDTFLLQGISYALLAKGKAAEAEEEIKKLEGSKHGKHPLVGAARVALLLNRKQYSQAAAKSATAWKPTENRIELRVIRAEALRLSGEDGSTVLDLNIPKDLKLSTGALEVGRALQLYSKKDPGAKALAAKGLKSFGGDVGAFATFYGLPEQSKLDLKAALDGKLPEDKAATPPNPTPQTPTAPAAKGGCGCSVVGTTLPSWPAMMLLSIVGLVAVNRRRL